MSVYRDTFATAVFEHPHTGPLTATVFRGEIQLGEAVSGLMPNALGQFQLPLTWVQTEFDGTLTVVWSADDFLRRQSVEVVTPIAPLSRFRTIFEESNKTDAELGEIEATVRVVIEAYTGQSFGFSIGTRIIRGNGGSTVLLNRRLNRLIAFSGGWPGFVTVGADGFSLNVSPKRNLGIKEAPPEELIGDHGVIITVPNWYITNFNKDATYTVTGEWGYDAVPEDVQEAALLLANDYITGDSGYRDRYLTILKIQQDSFTYHPGAFRGTGNARADLLLGPYRRKSGMIIL